jgi:hypothetical protein
MKHSLDGMPLHPACFAIFTVELVMSDSPSKEVKKKLLMIQKGGELSPLELHGKYMVAMGRLGGSNRQKPIYQRESELTEQEAIAEAAKALSALWLGSPGRSNRTAPKTPKS